MESPKIIIAGGSGFLGRTLAQWMAARGITPVILTRHPKAVPHGKAIAWDGRQLGPWAEELNGAMAVVNLAGRSVNCRYHRTNRDEIMDSRIRSTRILGEAIRRCQEPSPVWLNSSTATIYRHTLGPAWNETGDTGPTPEARDTFSVKVAQLWEQAFDQAEVPDATRKIALRTAMVMGAEPGGVYEVLRRLARTGLGGKMGRGTQYVSWLHAEDFCRAVDWLIQKNDASGTYNLSAPIPLPNAEMMAILRRVVGVPFGLPAPRFLLEIGAFFLRTETELVIKSRRVVPGRLLDEGFRFEFSHLSEAIAAIEASANPKL